MNVAATSCSPKRKVMHGEKVYFAFPEKLKDAYFSDLSDCYIHKPNYKDDCEHKVNPGRCQNSEEK